MTAPNLTVGIIGGGQLARMMALAGYPLGLDFLFLDPKPACAGDVGELLLGDYDDADKLAELAERCDVITFDFENVPESALRPLTDQVPVFPQPHALAAAQDRLVEKTLFRELEIPTPEYRKVDERGELADAAEALGFPCILKTRRFGYDGKGQFKLESAADIDAAWDHLGGKALILEQFIAFKRELSVIAVRSSTGETRYYPLTENRHNNGVLATSFAPANADDVAHFAQQYAERLISHFGYVGVITLELFDVGGRILANEMAPRVHNSGHWTIDGAITSQFENHLRAILGLPLGSTQAIGASAMINWIGAMPTIAQALRCPEAHWHNYGKKPRKGRKVGHTTLWAEDMVKLQQILGSFVVSLGSTVAKGVHGFLDQNN